MAPTALSQICEQVIKLAAGLYLAYLFMPDIEKAVGGAVFAVTLSEGVALAVFAVIYFFDARKEKRALPLKKTAERPWLQTLMKELTSCPSSDSRRT